MYGGLLGIAYFYYIWSRLLLATYLYEIFKNAYKSILLKRHLPKALTSAIHRAHSKRTSTITTTKPTTKKLQQALSARLTVKNFNRHYLQGSPSKTSTDTIHKAHNRKLQQALPAKLTTKGINKHNLLSKYPLQKVPHHTNVMRDFLTAKLKSTPVN